MLKEKAAINGHLWIDRSIVPRLMVYGFFFLGALFAEIAAILYTQSVDLIVETNFLYTTMILLTSAALVMFFAEGIVLSRRQKSRSNPLKEKGD